MSINWDSIYEDLRDDRRVEIPATEYGGAQWDEIHLSSAWPVGGSVVTEPFGGEDYETIFSGREAEVFIHDSYSDELGGAGVKAYAEAVHRLVARKLAAAKLHEPGVDGGRLNHISVEVSGTELEVTHGHERGGDPQWWVENAGAIIAGVLADKGAIYREMRV
ncbi:Uncharacterised protein (plasmid) [Tsukamurella tyrosinosolvens]|uniref:Uncharacterized protein n=1 Tax=Tsukamurella tyrosinosolvens TaxID=57704 RepID=A0A1H4UVM9_TSUTY|nr:hypothetical protein [Tsukamurella tyrosinosolvens]KXO98391.1 hypothetical protein AXK58_25295 [Tsukamurella tyrosinosolvens]SEC72478.1 hypothetical protein SAMN04489793_3046 [Tsukamurella tyrosinosolvens]VEH90869.1 Uncharacterised protein [Tsukamurella tyrosinosolvens]